MYVRMEMKSITVKGNINNIVLEVIKNQILEKRHIIYNVI